MLLSTTQRLFLQNQINTLLMAGKKEPAVLHHDNRSFVVKFERRETGRAWREYVSALACLVFFQAKVNPKALRAGHISHEAQRLVELKQQGIAVPELYLQTADYILMEHCGESVEYRLRRNPADTELLYAVIDSLLELHLAGQWHGGAQVRNLAIKNQKIYRFDFEENTGAAMPLDLAQSYDLMLCFNSLASHISQNPTLGTKLLAHYLNHYPNEGVIKRLERLLHYLNTISLVLPFLGRKTQQSKDIKQSLFFKEILQANLKT